MYEYHIIYHFYPSYLRTICMTLFNSWTYQLWSFLLNYWTICDYGEWNITLTWHQYALSELVHFSVLTHLHYKQYPHLIELKSQTLLTKKRRHNSLMEYLWLFTLTGKYSYVFLWRKCGKISCFNGIVWWDGLSGLVCRLNIFSRFIVCYSVRNSIYIVISDGSAGAQS